MPAKKKSAKTLRCPTCGMLVRFNDEDFPFCSDRCRKIDLGKWASGVYKISSPILDPEVLEDFGGGVGGVGFGKPGPGTWGSVAAVLVWAAYAKFAHPTPQTLLLALLAGIVLSIA